MSIICFPIFPISITNWKSNEIVADHEIEIAIYFVLKKRITIVKFTIWYNFNTLIQFIVQENLLLCCHVHYHSMVRGISSVLRLECAIKSIQSVKFSCFGLQIKCQVHAFQIWIFLKNYWQLSFKRGIPINNLSSVRCQLSGVKCQMSLSSVKCQF